MHMLFAFILCIHDSNINMRQCLRRNEVGKSVTIGEKLGHKNSFN